VAAARSGKRVLLAEVEGRGGAFDLLGLPRSGFEERRTPLGFSLLGITAREALLEYLWLFFRMGAVSRTLARAHVLETVTDGVPGFRDLMIAGKLYELTVWRSTSREQEARRRAAYDLVVVDAPPVGQVLGMLKAPDAYRGIIRAGKPGRQIESIDALFREGSRLALVATPEEMAVGETLEAVDALAEAGLPAPAVVANRVRPAPFPPGTRAAAGRATAASLRRMLREAGCEVGAESADELLRLARDEDARVRAEGRFVRRLGSRVPVVRLPLLATERFGRAEVDTLATVLAEEVR
jgi:anion-transporting  ArsA/GET3 family ATPase